MRETLFFLSALLLHPLPFAWVGLVCGGGGGGGEKQEPLLAFTSLSLSLSLPLSRVAGDALWCFFFGAAPCPAGWGDAPLSCSSSRGRLFAKPPPAAAFLCLPVSCSLFEQETPRAISPSRDCGERGSESGGGRTRAGFPLSLARLGAREDPVFFLTPSFFSLLKTRFSLSSSSSSPTGWRRQPRLGQRRRAAKQGQQRRPGARGRRARERKREEEEKKTNSLNFHPPSSFYSIYTLPNAEQGPGRRQIGETEREREGAGARERERQRRRKKNKFAHLPSLPPSLAPPSFQRDWNQNKDNNNNNNGDKSVSRERERERRRGRGRE